MEQYVRPIVASIIYSFLGTAILLASFWAIEKILPFSLRKEIAEDQNVGLGIIMGAFVLGIALIISAAIRG